MFTTPGTAVQNTNQVYSTSGGYPSSETAGTKLSVPLLIENLETYANQLNYLENNIFSLEKMGHVLHDTNHPVSDKGGESSVSEIGKLYELKYLNDKLINLNSKFDFIIQKLSTLI